MNQHRELGFQPFVGRGVRYVDAERLREAGEARPEHPPVSAVASSRKRSHLLRRALRNRSFGRQFPAWWCRAGCRY